MQEVEGKEWEDVLERRARLAEERETRQSDGPSWEATAHTGRLRGGQEEPLQGHWKMDLRSPCSTRGHPQKPAASQSTNICLNSKSPPTSPQSPVSSSSAQFSLDRGRSDLENRERELMRDVRELRRRLADNARNVQPPIRRGSLASEGTISNTGTGYGP